MSVSSTDNYIDPSDVELEADEFTSAIADKKEEIEELETELEDEEEEEEDAKIELESKIANAKDELLDIENEASDILELHEDCDNYARGSNLINESCFNEYCEEFAYECGEITRDSTMSFYVDWEKYAEDCKIDYTTITFQGTDFYVQG